MDSVPAEFDYRLTKEEEEQVKKLVLTNQRRLHTSFHSLISENNGESKNEIIALTEHMITIIKQNGKNMSISKQFHFYKIGRVKIVDEKTINIYVEKEDVITVNSPNCLMFARFIVRNYNFASILLPLKHKWEIDSYDKAKIRSLEPILTPTQKFQMMYNAYSSFYNTKYNHEIVKYVFNLMLTESSFFDFTQLPTHVVDSTLGIAENIQPVSSALKYYPYVRAFSCHHFSRKDVVSAISSLIIANQNFKIISLVDVGATSGCNKLYKSIHHTQEHSVLYWDLSDNVLSDMSDFTYALSEYKGQLKGIRLNNCKMDEEAVNYLFQSLGKNKNLFDCEEVSLSGNSISKENCLYVKAWLNSLKKANRYKLKMLSLGPVSNPPLIAELFDSCDQPLSVVRLVESKLTNDSLYDISRFVSRSTTLREFDISGCTISDKAFGSVLKSLQENSNLKQLSLGLNNLNLHGKKFKILTEFLSKGLSDKIVEIYVDNNGITREELNQLIVHVHVMNQLKKLSISGNFSYKDKDISQTILALLTSKSLESLIIRGNGKKVLKKQAIPILCGLFDNKKITTIDLSYNKIGDVGVKTAANLLLANHYIQSLEIDGSNITNPEVIDYYLMACAASKSILEARIPRDDLFKVVSEVNQQEKQEIFKRIAGLQDKVNENIFNNRNEAGIPTGLSLLKNPVLDEIIKSCVRSHQIQMSKVNITDQTDLSNILGIPLPNQTEDDLKNINQNGESKEAAIKNITKGLKSSFQISQQFADKTANNKINFNTEKNANKNKEENEEIKETPVSNKTQNDENNQETKADLDNKITSEQNEKTNKSDSETNSNKSDHETNSNKSDSETNSNKSDSETNYNKSDSENNSNKSDPETNSNKSDSETSSNESD